MEFDEIVDALATALGRELVPEGGLVCLVDEKGQEKLALEVGRHDGVTYAYAFICPMVSEDNAGAINQYLLQLNGDMATLGSARISVDPNRSQYYLVQPAGTFTTADEVLEFCEELVSKSEAIAELVSALINEAFQAPDTSASLNFIRM